jgi:hypothetical protein
VLPGLDSAPNRQSANFDGTSEYLDPDSKDRLSAKRKVPSAVWSGGGGRLHCAEFPEGLEPLKPSQKREDQTLGRFLEGRDDQERARAGEHCGGPRFVGGRPDAPNMPDRIPATFPKSAARPELTRVIRMTMVDRRCDTSIEAV